ncbi:MAG: hypothetical protein RIF46_09490, partial [Cyclobacteriaceae bacterium]
WVFTARFRVRSFKKTFGVWNSVKRTLKGYWAIGVDYQDQNWAEWLRISGEGYRSNVFDDELSVDVFGAQRAIWPASQTPGFHLYGTSIWGDSPSTPPAYKECNEGVICSEYFCLEPQG